MERPTRPVLLVSADPKEAIALRELLDPDHALDAPPASADAMLVTHLLGGMVVAVSVPPAISRPLVRAYLKHQPCGRVAVFSKADDVTTLTAYAFHEPRVELFFMPWRVETVRTFLGIAAALGIEAPVLA